MLESALEDVVDVGAFSFGVCMRSQPQAFSALTLPWRYGAHDSKELHRGCSHEGSCPHRSTLVLSKDSVIYFHGRSPHHVQITSASTRSPWSSSARPYSSGPSQFAGLSLRAREGDRERPLASAGFSVSFSARTGEPDRERSLASSRSLSTSSCEYS